MNLLALVPGLPLALALLLVPGRSRAWVPALAPLALVPALAVGVLAPQEPLGLEGWLLGIELGLDPTGRLFLLLSALAWLGASLYARAWLATDPHRLRFSGFFLAAMAGNLGLCLAQDALGFYLFFALMTFSAWGLILHRGHAAARRAARIYLVLAVAGEAALLVALWLVVANGGDAIAQAPATVAAAPQRDVIVALLLVGFGVKTGLLGLHMALPLAYGTTPAPGAAVLASAMIKAGLLGWLRFLPLGEALPGWSALLMGLGLVAAFYGVAVGLLQQAPRVILAYSSISQMGLISLALGLGLARPEAAGPALFAVTLYALHHALVKAALFLGEGLSRAAAHGGLFAGMVLLALALAGAPLTGGALAKHYLKDLTAFTPVASPGLLGGLLALASLGTTLLMARFLWQLRRRSGAAARPHPALWLSWLLALAIALLAPWLLPVEAGAQLAPAALWSAAWPLLAGAALALLAARLLPGAPLSVPSGDILVPLERLIRRTWRRGRALTRMGLTRHWRRLRDPCRQHLQWLAGPSLGVHLEAGLRPWRRFGVLGLAIALTLVVLLGLP